jgi:hypothetical protein
MDHPYQDLSSLFIEPDPRIAQMQAEMNSIAKRMAEQMQPALEAFNHHADYIKEIQDAAARATEPLRMAAEEAKRVSDFLRVIDPLPSLALKLASDLRIPTQWTRKTFDVTSLPMEEAATVPASTKQEVVKQAAEALTNEIENAVALSVENSSDVVHLELTEEGIFRNPDLVTEGHRASIHMCRLIMSLGSRFTPTPKLTELSGYKNDESTRTAIQKLNRIGKNVLNTNVVIVIGEEGQGYRLSKSTRIRRKWRDRS